MVIFGQRLGKLAHSIGEEGQVPRRGDSRIQQLQGAGCRVSRIGKGRLAGFGAELVQFDESACGHINLAADFDHGGDLAVWQ